MDEKVKKSLGYAIKDGSWYFVMVNFGEASVSLFAAFLKATDAQLGLIAGIPQAVGPSFNLLSAELVDWLKNRRLIMTISAVIQGLVWLPICLSVFMPPQVAVWILLVGMIVYLAGLHMSIPPFMSIMGDLVPPDTRGAYFGRRNMITEATGAISAILAGVCMQVWKMSELEKWGFFCIFLVAFLARMNSAAYLWLYYEPPYQVQKSDHFTFIQFLKRYKDSNFLSFVIYTAIIRVVAAFSGWSFIIYEYRDLKFSYFQIFVLIGISAKIMRAITMPYWGKLADRLGNKKIITLTGYGTGLICFLWLVYPSVWTITFAEAFSGFIWAGWELCVSNFIFDSVTPPKRARCTAYFNIINGFAIFLGATAGGIFAQWMREASINSIAVGNFTIHFISELQILIALSGFLRIWAHMKFINLFKEVRSVQDVHTQDLLLHIMQIKDLAVLTVESDGKKHTQ